MTGMATALCVVDMLNPYDHEDADRLTQSVESVVEPLSELVARARDEGAENSSQEELAERALQCILYSALDAYVRHLRVSVPPDAVAHIHEDLAEAALTMMERNMSAGLVGGADVRLAP
jgi:nicotinamidase-related amidase